MRLAFKVIIVFLIVVTALTSIHGWLAVRRERELFEKETERSAKDFGKKLEDTLILAWRSNRPEEVVRLIRQSFGDKPGSMVRWVWFDTMQEGSSSSDAQLPIIDMGELVSLRPGEPISFQSTGKDGQRYLHTYYPIAVEPWRHGGLEFSTPLSVLNTRYRQIIYQTLYLIATISLISVALVVFLGVYMVGRPLEQLIEKTRRIGAGDFTHPLTLRRNDELEQLASALNEMSSQLADQQLRIQNEATARLQTIEQLRHADRLKTVGRLAAGIAHELGTPLNVVAGRADMIAAGKLEPDAIRQSATTIKQEIDRITKVIRQLLDFARRSSPQRSRVDMNHLIRQTAELLEPLFGKNSISLQLNLPDPPVMADVDAGQTQQVLTNLLVNGMQAMPHGGPLTLSMRTEAVGSRQTQGCLSVVIEVVDRGVGISAQDLPLIFEPFFTTKDVGSGTGLGLSIVHGIVTEHGGTVTATSSVGQGTTFKVVLPLSNHEPASSKDQAE